MTENKRVKNIGGNKIRRKKFQKDFIKNNNRIKRTAYDKKI